MSLLAFATLGGCVSGPTSGAGPYPKFSDIPLKPTATKPKTEAQADAAIIQGMAAKLASESAGAGAADSDAAALTASRDAVINAPVPGDDDAASTEAFAKAARARATPPPARK